MTSKALLLLLASASAVSALSLDCLPGQASDADFLSEPASPEAKATIDEGERAFAVRLVKYLFDEMAGVVDKNIFVSPASVFQTLMLSYMGSAGETERELAETMGISSVSRADVVKNYLFERAFQAIRERDANLGYELTHANKFYFDRALGLSDCLSLVLQEELEAVDFSHPEKARSIINSWVKERTRGKITDLIPSGSLSVENDATLVNAAYFKGEWASRFESNDTERGNFYVRRDKISITEFMSQKGKFNYYTSEELRAHVLELPYLGDEVSMIVILPPFEDHGLFETVSRLTPDTLRGVMSEVKSGFYSVDDLAVKLPKFHVEQSLNLVKPLSALGLKTLFDPLKSDLSGFLSPEARDGRKVKLGDAVHKSFIDVNEEGSEAAAATALFGFRSARPLFHTQFVADHPFLFLIYDKPSDTILFFGVFQDPKL